jgi:Ca2+-binding EF-hand superfamily protein/predicted ferric reductase
MFTSLNQLIVKGKLNGRPPDPIAPVEDVTLDEQLQMQEEYSDPHTNNATVTEEGESMISSPAFASNARSLSIVTPVDSHNPNEDMEYHTEVVAVDLDTHGQNIDSVCSDSSGEVEAAGSPSSIEGKDGDHVDGSVFAVEVISGTQAQRQRRVAIGGIRVNKWTPGLAINAEETSDSIDDISSTKSVQPNDGTASSQSEGDTSPEPDRQAIRRQTIKQFPWLNECVPTDYANGRSSVSRTQFMNFFVISDVFSDKLFVVFDSDESGSVSKREVMGALGKLKCRPAHDKAMHRLDAIFSDSGDAYNEFDIEQFKKVVLNKETLSCLFELFDTDGNGLITTAEMHISLDKISCMDNNAKLLAWMDEQFTKIAGEKRSITRDEFKEALNAKNTFFVDRIFNMLDTDESGSLDLVELIDGIASFISGDRKEKMRFLFRVYDADNNGYIDRDELRTYLRNCLDESSLQIPPYQFERLVSVVFDDADEDGSDTITFEEMQAQLDRHPMILDDLSLSAGNWFRPAERPTKKKCKRPKFLTKSFLRNNLSSIVFWVLYILLSAGLFVEAVSRHGHNSNGYIMVARGCGQLLNLNSAFVLTLMLRNTITFLRSTFLSRVIDFDNYIAAHKVVGFVIFGCSIVHTAMHLVNIGRLTTTMSLTYAQILLTTAGGVGWVAASAFITGDLLMVILIIMVICALPCIRRCGYFCVFFATHQLYIAYMILLVLHGPSSWKWVCVPALLFLIEVIRRMKCVNRLRLGKTYLLDAKTLPSNVTHLVIKRPKKFNFKAGDYVFLNIPSIAGFEWHPFTISSPPEEKEYIWLHVRAVGNWTKRLFNFIEHITTFKKTSRATASARKGMRKFISTQNRRVTQEKAIQKARREEELEAKQRKRKESLQRAIEASKLDAWSRSKSGDVMVQKNVLKLFDWRTIRNGVAPELNVTMVESGPPASQLDPPPVKEKDKSTVVEVEESGVSSIQVYLDGPYGAPATDIFNTDHAVLIAAGIGVTPFACILQSIMNRYTAAMVECPKCNHEWIKGLPSSIVQLKKVDFIWINRDQKAFDWFLSILAQLEEQQKKLSIGRLGNFLDIHLYLTSLLKKNDVKAIGLQMALDLMHEVENEDVITGLKTQMQPGRPDWDKLFQGFVDEGKGEVTVFYCGPPFLSDLLGEKCAQFGFNFKREIF